MTIPDYQTIMLPLLRFLGDGRERSLSEAVEAISEEFLLTPDQRQQLLPSGTSTVIGSRVGWARTYMKKAGLVESTRRGFVRATKRGLDVLKQNPQRIDVKFLEQFPEFVEFRARRREEAAAPAPHARYGGSFRDAGQAVGRSGDGGIDGILKEDRLGLDVIYIQAKRWEAAVGRRYRCAAEDLTPTISPRSSGINTPLADVVGP